ncbi:helix-turn-helix domain-containing protein [Streptosporangium sp. NPDC050855]|uniref:helix-turn-helix domain-containing protein n=1 Tax=Streptosporangium sp. NPDC050855 TaxID=3366194 RepID=UPI0037AFD23E
MSDQPPAAPFHALVVSTLKRQGKNMTWLGQRSGVSRNTIGNWAKQPRPPQPGTVLQVADALGIEHDRALQLSGLTDAPPPPLGEDLADLSTVPTDALVDQLRLIGDELRRRIPD